MEKTMKFNSLRGLGWVCGFAVAAAVAVAGCGGHTDGPVGGSESHFLAYCEDTCGDGLDCISGVCTRGCVVDQSDCSDLAASSMCTAESIEPGAVAVCDVSCSGDDDCSELGEDHRCDGGFCRKPSGQGGGSGGSTGSGGSGGDPNPTTCDVDGTIVESGSLVPNPESCGYCTCDDGELACDDAPCDGVLPVPACDQVIVPGTFQAAPIEILDFRYLRDDGVLEIDVGHGGGCEEHTYGLCFALSSDSAAELRLTHDGNGDPCEAYPQTTLSFDLSSVEARFADDATLMVTYDDPENLPQVLQATAADSCTEEMQVAGPHMAEFEESLDKSCDTPADCVWASSGGACWPAGCGTVASMEGAAAVDAEAERLSQNVCGHNCEFSPPLCEERGELDCVDGACVEVFP
jgi:hypothetical protein